MLNEEIAKQADIGFSKNEIIDNLKAKGYSKEEVDTAIAQFNFSTATATNAEGSVSTKSILLGVLFVIVMIIRLGRAANTGSIFAILGIFTAAGMAYYFFTKKK
jgi:MFS superfamily sulfate permease-like transporter